MIKFASGSKVLSKNQKQENIAKWILSTINNSISEPSQHYNSEDLQMILIEQNMSKKYHYAIVALFKEVDYHDLLEYCEVNDIDEVDLKTFKHSGAEYGDNKRR
jgi:predicted transcriptional regulator